MFRSLVWGLCSDGEKSSSCSLFTDDTLLGMSVVVNKRVNKFQLAGRVILTLEGFLALPHKNQKKKKPKKQHPSVFKTTEQPKRMTVLALRT